MALIRSVSWGFGGFLWIWWDLSNNHGILRQKIEEYNRTIMWLITNSNMGYIYIYTVSISRICWCAKIKYEDMNRMIALRMVISLPLSLFLSLSIPPYRYSNPHKKSKSENQWCKSARKHILSIYIYGRASQCVWSAYSWLQNDVDQFLN